MRVHFAQTVTMEHQRPHASVNNVQNYMEIICLFVYVFI